MRTTLRTGVGIAVGCAGLLTVVVATGQTARTAADVEHAQQAALRQSGLRGAAAVTGSFDEVLNFADEAGPTSLASMVRASNTILMGRVVSNYSVLPPGGRFIRTEYKVRVQEFLKGSANRGDRDLVTISMAGGRVSFSDGSQAQQSVRNANPPLDGRRYVFFLLDVPEVSKRGPNAIEVPEADFWPLRGSYGVFELPENGSGVRPGLNKVNGDSNSPSRQYKGLYPESMLLDLRREIKESDTAKR